MSVSSRAKLRNLLGWAFLISIALHLALAPLARLIAPVLAAVPPQDDMPLRIERFPLRLPTPQPVVQRPPRATRPTAASPPRRRIAHAPHVPHVATSTAVTQAEIPRTGTSPGVAIGSGTVPATSTGGGQGYATPQPTPSPTEKPVCTQPHVEARVTHAVEPEYSALAQQQGATGTTEVEVSLSESGAVVEAKIYRSSGNAGLDAAALTAARESTYAPEIDDCKKTGGSYLFRAEFTAQ